MLNTKMVFREGERDRFLYDTHFGAATLGVEHTVASRNILNMSVRLRS